MPIAGSLRRTGCAWVRSLKQHPRSQFGFKMTKRLRPWSKVAYPKAVTLSLSLLSAQKQHSNIAAQHAIRSPQHSDAAKAAPPVTMNAAAATSFSFMVLSLEVR